MQEFYDVDDFEEAIRDGIFETNCWSTTDGEAYFVNRPTKPEKRLPPDRYTITFDQYRGIGFQKHDVVFDELIMLPDNVSDEIMENINDFWGMKAHFDKYGYVWKRGVLMHGPPGSGKTSTLVMVSQNLIDRGGIVVYSNNLNLLPHGLRTLRSIEPDRPIVVILEDLDMTIYNGGGEEQLTALLEGELQIDNVVYIATTNHVEDLDSRLTNRPSRFDLVKKVGMPSAAARKVYINEILNRANDSVDNIDEWVELTKGYSVAHLKELIISVQIFKLDLHKAVERLNRLLNNDFETDEYADVDEDDCEAESPIRLEGSSGTYITTSSSG